MKGKLSMKEITCNITKPIAVLSENDRGYTKEANFVSWNERDAKLDIREWHPDIPAAGKVLRLPKMKAVDFGELLPESTLDLAERRDANEKRCKSCTHPFEDEPDIKRGCRVQQHRNQ